MPGIHAGTGTLGGGGMLGWPNHTDQVTLGGRLALLPGLVVFVSSSDRVDATAPRPGGGSLSRDAAFIPSSGRAETCGFGVARPSALGWPSADIVEPLRSVASQDPVERPIGATIRTDAGRDETVHEHGMTPQRSVYGGASRAYASSRPYGATSRSSYVASPPPFDTSSASPSSADGAISYDGGGSRLSHGDGLVSRETSSGVWQPEPDATGYRDASASLTPGGVPAVEFTAPTPHNATGYQPDPASARLPSPRPQAAAAVQPVVVSAETNTAYGASEGEATVESDSEDPPLAMEAMRAVQILNPSGEVSMPRPSRPRVMCVANQKGGVGKTTTTVNLAVALALHGNRVVVIDLDPQGNASTGLNVPHHAGVPDVYDCLIDNVPLEDVAQTVEGIPNLWCVPATIDLAGAEIELVSVVARESRLGRAISAYPTEYDYIFVDCPPSLGLLTVNALVAAQEVLIPIQCEYYALEGLNQLLNNINLVKAHLNPELDVSTILLTMYDRRTRLADAVEQDVRNHFGDKVLTSVIPRNVRVSEAPSYGQSVMTYDPGSRGATSYFEAAQEIAERGAKIGVSS